MSGTCVWVGIVEDDNLIYGEDDKSTCYMRNNIRPLIITLAPVKWLELGYIRRKRDRRAGVQTWTEHFLEQLSIRSNHGLRLGEKMQWAWWCLHNHHSHRADASIKLVVNFEQLEVTQLRSLNLLSADFDHM